VGGATGRVDIRLDSGRVPVDDRHPVGRQTRPSDRSALGRSVVVVADGVGADFAGRLGCPAAMAER
jgi:hypothetical protein